MANAPKPHDSKARRDEKQRSRDDDARALSSGAKSVRQLRDENGRFVFPRVRISLRGGKPLE